MWQASAYAPAIVTKRLPQIWQVKSCNRFTHSPTAVLRTVRVTVNWRLSGVSFPLGAPTFARLSPGISSGNGSKSELGNLSILNRQILKPSRPRSSQYLAMQAASETGDDSASPRISNSRFAAQLSEPPRGRSSALATRYFWRMLQRPIIQLVLFPASPRSRMTATLSISSVELAGLPGREGN